MNAGGSSVEAPLNPKWSAKWTIAAVLLLVWAGLCFYDGAVKYPEQNRRYERFQELVDRGQEDRWPEVAAEQGWSDEKPGEDANYSQSDITMQWVMGWLSLAGGLAAGARWLRYRGGRLAVEDDVLVGPRGQRVPLSAIREVDKSKWENKGIATARYEDGERSGKVMLDEWMYPEAEAVLTELERRTGLGDPDPLVR